MAEMWEISEALAEKNRFAGSRTHEPCPDWQHGHRLVLVRGEHAGRGAALLRVYGFRVQVAHPFYDQPGCVDLVVGPAVDLVAQLPKGGRGRKFDCEINWRPPVGI